MSISSKFVVTCSYQWTIDDKKNTISETAIKKVVGTLNKRYKGKKHAQNLEYKIEFKRLRASAGRFLADSFYNRILQANAIIIDVTHFNPNVMLELGMAYAIQKGINPNLSIYLIAENKITIPSNMQGYFVSSYIQEKNNIVFKDQGSLMMSLSSDVKDHYNQIITSSIVDEINEKD